MDEARRRQSRLSSAKYWRAKQAGIKAGTWQPRRSSSSKAKRHIRWLMDTYGVSAAAIAEAVGIDDAIIQKILNGYDNQRYVLRTTEDAILACQNPLDRIAGHRRASTCGARRRIRALQSIGHTLADIASEADLSVSRLSDICTRERVMLSSIRAVCAAYDRLYQVDGSSKSARMRAEKKGWPGPEAWDDASIDDPRAKPVVRARRARVDVGAVVDTVVSGVPVTVVCSDLQVTVQAVERAAWRHINVHGHSLRMRILLDACATARAQSAAA